MTSKTKIFIDFDGTIFNSKRFKHDLNQIMVALGVPESVVEAEYEEWKKTHRHPDPVAMMTEMAQIHGFDINEALRRRQQIVDSAKDYLYADALKFLQSIDRGKFSPILFTLGYEHWQSEKIEKCEIADLFDKFIYTEKEKVQTLADLVGDGEEFYVVDDSLAFMEAAKEKFPNGAKIVGVDRYDKNRENTDINFAPNLSNGIGIEAKSPEELKAA